MTWARPLARRAIRQYFHGVLGVAGALTRPLRRARPSPPRTILVVRLDLLGDMVFSMAAVEALRITYPDAHLTMLTLPYTAPLARLYPAVDEVIAVDTNRIRTLRGLLSPATWREYWRVYRQLRARRIDLAVSLSGPMASLWATLSGAKRVIGYAGEAYPFMLTQPVPGRRYQLRRHEVEYDLELAAAAGATSYPTRLHLAAPSDATERAASILHAIGIPPESCLILIHPGAGNGTAKRWPVSHWIHFIRQMLADGRRPILIGGSADQPLAEQITLEVPDVPSLVGKTSIEDLVALLARADLLVTGDSGPLHLAVALGRSVVAVYGPTDPTIYGPFRPTAPTVVLRRDLPCSPCYTATAPAACPLGHTLCMKLVTVEAMVEAARRGLGE